MLPATVAALMGAASPAAYLVAALPHRARRVVLCRSGQPVRSHGRSLSLCATGVRTVRRLRGGLDVPAHARRGGGGHRQRVRRLSRLVRAGAGVGGRVGTSALTAIFGRLAAINYAGVRYGTRAVNLFTWAKAVPLLVFVAVGLLFLDPADRIDLFSAAAHRHIARGQPACSSSRSADSRTPMCRPKELKNPRRDLPIALLVGRRRHRRAVRADPDRRARHAAGPCARSDATRVGRAADFWDRRAAPS